MVELTAEEKAAITATWTKVKAEELGVESLERSVSDSLRDRVEGGMWRH